ncbi:hypothetical protein R3P38DRAFT_2785319 [Favolaschia claudopus]|uniref:Uncharacterized protein n=1 Tax=Favolaschia claudopus TaxID=2862362 RepID=A0AAW0AXC5_9AGAR
MGRGRKTTLPQDKTEYLQSFYGEFSRRRPNFGTFWGDVERGWALKWPAAVALGLPLLDPAGAAIEGNDRTTADQLAIAAAELKDRKAIQIMHQWFYNRASKEKSELNSSQGPSTGNGTLQDIMKALGTGRRTRRLQRREIWQKRNSDLINAAVKEAGFELLMGSSYEGETEEEREQRISKGRSDQAALRSQVVSRLWSEASEEEMTAVEEQFQKQPKPSKKSKNQLQPIQESELSPEDYQRGIDKVGPLLKNVHKYVEHFTGLVGSTVLVGPIPNNGGKIGTQSYCHGVTPAGHTLDQAHSGWTDHVIKPLQQFGKKIFDHETRRKRALHADDDRDSNGTPSPNTAEEVPSDTSTTTLPPVQTTSMATNSSVAASQALGNLSGGTTTLFLPGEDDSGQENDYPPLDFDLGYFPLPDDLLSNPERIFGPIFAPPPHAGVSPLDPILPSSVLGDSSPAEHRAEPISPATTLAIVSPAPPAAQASIARPSLRPASFESGSNWIFPSSMPPTPRLAPSTPTPFARQPPLAPASAPPPVRHLASAGLFLPPASASAPSTPTATRRSADLVHQVARPSPLRVSTTPAASPPSATPAPTSITAAPSTLAATSPTAVPDAPAPASCIAPTSTAPAPNPTTFPVATAPALPATPHLRSALTADDFPVSRPLSNAPPAPKANDAVVSGSDGGRGRGRGGGRGGRGGGRGGRGGGRGGRGGGRGRGGGAGGGGGGEDDGYLLRVDAEKGNVWQIGTVSREMVKEIRAREKARDDAQAKVASDRDHGIFVFPPPPPGHAPLPTAPAALGHAVPRPEPRVLGARERTSTKRYVPQKKRTMEEVRADAAKRKADKEAEKVAEAARKREEKEKSGGKRKANAENVRPGASKRRHPVAVQPALARVQPCGPSTTSSGVVARLLNQPSPLFSFIQLTL